MVINQENIISFMKEAESAFHNGNIKDLEQLYCLNISSVGWDDFYCKLLKVKEDLTKDLEFFMLSDPAVDSEEEVILTYPGYKAILYHRIANILYKMNMKVIARVVSEHAHFLTGIDIHPGAQIGSPFFIDHGTGIVIGETSIIGDRVKIYQGVTLGALSLAKGVQLKGTKRHPTIKDDVTLYSGASILGDITVGNRVTIGSNVFLLDSVEDDYKVTLSKPSLILIKK